MINKYGKFGLILLIIKIILMIFCLILNYAFYKISTIRGFINANALIYLIVIKNKKLKMIVDLEVNEHDTKELMKLKRDYFLEDLKK